MAVGKKEFIEFALKRHRELKHKNIPLLRAAKRKICSTATSQIPANSSRFT